MKKVIIVGAGISALAVAIPLQKAGYQVNIYEKTPLPGGKIGALKNEQFAFDFASPFITMPQKIENLFILAGKKMEDYLHLEPLEPLFFSHKEGKSYSFSSNMASLTPTLNKLSPSNSQGFFAYLGQMQKRFSQGEKPFLFKNFTHWKDLFHFSTLKEVVKMGRGVSSKRALQKFMPHSFVPDLLSFYNLFESKEKSAPSYFTFFPMLAFSYGIWTVKGGTFQLIMALEKLFVELGGNIHYSQGVDKILIENQKAYGVQIGNQLALADYVISNVDFPFGMKHLIKDPQVKGKYTDEKVDSMVYSPSALLFTFETDIPFSHSCMNHYYISKNFDENLEQLAQGTLLKDPSFHLTFSTNQVDEKSLIKILIPLSNLTTAKYGWEEETINYYKNKVLSSLKNIKDFENLSHHIISEKAYTPLDFQNTYNAYAGALFGLLPTFPQSGFFRPKSKAEHCQGLYFVGSSVHPGPGLPFLLEGATMVVKDILNP